jgi:hypothetical protein
MKWFALQRGTRGPEPVIFHDEPPVAKAHKLKIVDGSLKQVPAEFENLPNAELIAKMQAK